MKQDVGILGEAGYGLVKAAQRGVLIAILGRIRCRQSQQRRRLRHAQAPGFTQRRGRLAVSPQAFQKFYQSLPERGVLRAGLRGLKQGGDGVAGRV